MVRQKCSGIRRSYLEQPRPIRHLAPPHRLPFPTKLIIWARGKGSPAVTEKQPETNCGMIQSKPARITQQLSRCSTRSSDKSSQLPHFIRCMLLSDVRFM